MGHKHAKSLHHQEFLHLSKKIWHHENEQQQVQSIQDINALLEKSGATAELFFLRTYANLMMGHYRDAILDSDQCAYLFSHNTSKKMTSIITYDDICYTRAICRLHLKYYEEARRDFLECTKIEHLRYKAYLNLSCLFFYQQQYDICLEFANLACEFAQADGLALGNRGIVYMFLGNYEHAIADLTASFSKDMPHDQRGFFHFARAIASAHLQKYDESLKDVHQISWNTMHDPSIMQNFNSLLPLLQAIQAKVPWYNHVTQQLNLLGDVVVEKGQLYDESIVPFIEHKLIHHKHVWNSINVYTRILNTSITNAHLNRVFQCFHFNLGLFLGLSRSKKDIILVSELSPFGSVFTNTIQFTLSQILYMCHDMINALDYLHSQNIVHGNVCPITAQLYHYDRWTIKLIDYGLTHIDDATIMIAYSSPEQAKNKKIKYKHDVYQFGLVAYTLIEGEILYHEYEYKDLEVDTTSNDLSSVDDAFVLDTIESSGHNLVMKSKLWTTEWKQLVHDCCNVNPKQRPTIEEVKHRLQAFK